ncbi:hypothetical protein KC323_g9295 [Hortaea werneckii]|nr:hypothetical protein KC323_g9295 [Hortaea werneckii]
MSESSGALGDRLVVGIDFGTTFSGVAFAHSGTPKAPDEIAVIKTWPGGNNTTSEKVPSVVSYQKVESSPLKRKANDAFDFEAFTSTAVIPQTVTSRREPSSMMKRGFQVGADEQRIRCLKLLLDPDQNILRFVSYNDIEKQLALSQKNAKAVVAEYLGALFSHAQQVLIDRYGELFVATTKQQIVLTVPAVWSDAAKNKTLKAAEAAAEQHLHDL